MSLLQYRLVIYAEDVRRMTGRQQAASYRLLRKIRKKFALEKNAIVTVEHFCNYTGLSKQDVLEYLQRV